jgi:hypothetical protein
VAKPAKAAATADAAPAPAPGAAPRVRSVTAPQVASQQQVRAVPQAAAHPAAVAASPGIAREIAARTRTLGRHELGDTRYRRINYTAIATTRYREYLPFTDKEIVDAEPNGAKCITRHSQAEPIDVLSSARPAAPRIVYVVPTFGWTRKSAGSTMSSERRGGGLRVYLERPWFSSGDGELLGVIVGQPVRPGKPTAMMPPPFPNALKPYFTQWGMDPIWAASPTPTELAPQLDNFRSTTATETDLTLDELEGARVSVAGYTVGSWDADGALHGYDPERGLWFCDVEIDPGDAYFPFIRLALARYQPHALRWPLGDVKLSRVIVADFAQLTPDRAVSVTQVSETELNVVLTGVSYREGAADTYRGGGPDRMAAAMPAVARSDAVQAAAKPAAKPVAVQSAAASDAAQTAAKAAAPAPAARREIGAAKVSPAAAEGGSTVEVSVETRPAGGSDLGWVLVPDATFRLQGGAQLGARRTWSGRVTLPAARGTKPFRLVIREHELFLVDADSEMKTVMVSRPTAHRLVFAETLEL